MTSVPQAEEPLLEDRVALFLDFVGFAEFTRNADDSQNAAMVKLLIDISKWQGPQQPHIEEFEGSERHLAYSPEITTFSDHIVASYPVSMPAQFDLPPVVYAGMIVGSACFLTMDVALAGLKLGLCVRGGLAIGKMYHKGPVVTGAAMIEAHELESKVAVYPRVVMSPRLDEFIGTNTAATAIDSDGMRHLDYTTMLRAAVNHRRARNPDAISLDQIRAIIAEKMTSLRSAARSAELAKWSWLNNQLADPKT